MHDPETMLKAATQAVLIGMKALAPRILTFLTLFITAGLFGWAAYRETPLSLGVAGAFAVIVFLPVLRKDTKEQ